jgi:hypothetical protein
MRITIIGNCQISPLRKIMSIMYPEAEFPSLPAVHMINKDTIGIVESAINSSDIIVGQLIADDFGIELVRTSYLRSRYQEKLICWPNLYFKGNSPEVDVMHDAEYLHFRGPLFDYHHDKILYGFIKGMSVQATANLLCEESDLDAHLYATTVEDGLSELRRREMHCDVIVTDLIEEMYSQERLFHIMNHPSNRLLLELADRIFAKAAIKGSRKPETWMIGDFELNFVIAGENDYLRAKYNARFPRSPFARGVQMIPANNVLGVTTGDTRLFNETELTEAFFGFYTPHAKRLQNTHRVRALLNRVGPLHA